MKTYTAEDFRKWGAQGGAKSSRELTPAQAREMVAAREKKRRKTKRVARRANVPDQRPGDKTNDSRMQQKP
jgi:topoisomerase IA-like protein